MDAHAFFMRRDVRRRMATLSAGTPVDQRARALRKSATAALN
jgi:hypothetical protein